MKPSKVIRIQYIYLTEIQAIFLFYLETIKQYGNRITGRFVRQIVLAYYIDIMDKYNLSKIQLKARIHHIVMHTDMQREAVEIP